VRAEANRKKDKIKLEIAIKSKDAAKQKTEGICRELDDNEAEVKEVLNGEN
jgi:hypothetical protein